MILLLYLIRLLAQLNEIMREKFPAQFLTMKDPHQEDSSHHQDRHRQPHCWVSFLTKVRCLSLPLCRGSEKAQSVENMHMVTAFVLITFLTAETQIPEKGRVCLVREWQWYSPFWKGSTVRLLVTLHLRSGQTDRHAPLLTWFPCSFPHFYSTEHPDYI